MAPGGQLQGAAEVGWRQWRWAPRGVPRRGARSRGRRGSGLQTQESPFSGAHAASGSRHLHGQGWGLLQGQAQRVMRVRHWRPQGTSRFSALQVNSLPAEPLGKSKNTRVGSLSLFQGIFLTQESNQDLPHCRWILQCTTTKDPTWHKILCASTRTQYSRINKDLQKTSIITKKRRKRLKSPCGVSCPLQEANGELCQGYAGEPWPGHRVTKGHYTWASKSQQFLREKVSS